MKCKNKLLFFMLYFFEGAPIGLVWWAVPTIMSDSGVTVDTITTLTAMAALPWTFKFLLGPLVDRYFFTVRGHALAVVGFQTALLFVLGGLLTTSIEQNLFFYLTLALSLFAAAQDVFIDAWAIGVVSENERGQVNGAMQAGMLLGRWVFGAGLLIALAHLNWQFAVAGLSALLLVSICILTSKYARDSKMVNPAATTVSLKSFSFIISPKFLFLALVAGLTGFAFESFGAVVGPFFIANGFSKEQVGQVLSLTLLTLLFGSLAGGRLTDLRGAHRVFLISGLALAVLVVLLGFLHLQAGGIAIITITAVTYFFIGSFTASSYAFYMGQAQGQLEATRFTFLMAMTNLCESLAAFSVGRLAAGSTHTYTMAFACTSAISLLGLAVLWRGNVGYFNGRIKWKN